MSPKEAVVEVVVVADVAIEFGVFVFPAVVFLRLVLLVQLVVFTAEAVLVVVAKSNVVESTANSVGEPTRSNVIEDDEVLEGAPDPFELRLLLAVEVTEVAKMFCCCCEANNFWLC